jgi:hypothetical protein
MKKRNLIHESIPEREYKKKILDPRLNILPLRTPLPGRDRNNNNNKLEHRENLRSFKGSK